jgi:hypothetical protein
MLIVASRLANVKTVRAGVVPYTIIDGITYFLLARDRLTKELGDFGGGVKKFEYSLMAGLREWHEESRGIFSEVCRSANDIATAIAVIDKRKMAVIFVPLKKEWKDEAQKLFEAKSEAAGKKRSNEVSSLVWVDESRFRNLIDGETVEDQEVMWKKIRSHFSGMYKNNHFSEALKAAAMAY